MSILIKGIDMPTARDTLVLVKTDGTAIVYEDEAYVTTAVHVPPHGRLIDADALPLEESVPTVMMHDGEWWISAYELAMAPTIIPAEEEKA